MLIGALRRSDSQTSSTSLARSYGKRGSSNTLYSGELKTGIVFDHQVRKVIYFYQVSTKLVVYRKMKITDKQQYYKNIVVLTTIQFQFRFISV